MKAKRKDDELRMDAATFDRMMRKALSAPPTPKTKRPHRKKRKVPSRSHS